MNRICPCCSRPAPKCALPVTSPLDRVTRWICWDCFDARAETWTAIASIRPGGWNEVPAEITSEIRVFHEGEYLPVREAGLRFIALKSKPRFKAPPPAPAAPETMPDELGPRWPADAEDEGDLLLESIKRRMRDMPRALAFGIQVARLAAVAWLLVLP